MQYVATVCATVAAAAFVYAMRQTIKTGNATVAADQDHATN
jgi:hypothetical protein